MSTHERLQWLCGPYDRGVASVDESNLVHETFAAVEGRPASSMLMIDVGAHFGGSLRPFANDGWTVHAFEPDPANRERLTHAFDEQPLVTINPNAVSPDEGETLQFYTSPESTGVSTLQPFLDSHEATITVTTRRLDHYLHENQISHVDYLKVDAEGYDGLLLQSYPFHRDRPDIVTCEFEDFKTEKLGYRSNDLAEWLVGLGYTVFVSEWWPIVRYGIAHDFRGIWRYNSEAIEASGWGNLVAIWRPGLLEPFEVVAAGCG